MANGNDEGAESNRSEMVTSEPLEALHHAILLLICALFEIPNACTASDDELSAAEQECVDPEESENIVSKDVASLWEPHDLSDKFKVLSWLSFSHSPYIKCAKEPNQGPHSHHKVRECGQSEDTHVVLHEFRGSLEHGNTKLDCTVAAAHGDQDDHCDSPQNIGSPGKILILRLLGKVTFLTTVVERVKTSTDECQLSNNKSDPNDCSSNDSDYEEVKVTENEGNNRAGNEEWPAQNNVKEIRGSSFSVITVGESLSESFDCLLGILIGGVWEAETTNSCGRVSESNSTSFASRIVLASVVHLTVSIHL